MKDLLRMGSAALEHLERTLAARLQATSPLPRVLRLADKIGLQRKEEVLPGGARGGRDPTLTRAYPRLNRHGHQ